MNALKQSTESITGQMTTLDRYLPVWIIIAMIAGLLLGLIDGVQEIFNAVQFGSTSLPIAIPHLEVRMDSIWV